MHPSRASLLRGLVLFSTAFALAVVAAVPATAVSADRYVADEVVYDPEPNRDLEYIHIFYEPNVCIYGGFNCAIIVFEPDHTNPNGRTVAHVLKSR